MAYVALTVLAFGVIAGIAAVVAGRGRARRVAAALGGATLLLLAALLVADIVLLRKAPDTCPDAQSAGGGLQIGLGIAATAASAAGLGASARAARRDPLGGSVLAVTELLAAGAALALTFAPWLCGLR